MGARGNIELQYKVKGETRCLYHCKHLQSLSIFLYTHWDGGEMPTILKNALIRGRGRWSDPMYLGRIIFSEMIQNEVLEETGYGIGPEPGEDQYPRVVVNMDAMTVTIENKTVSFEKFVE